MIPGVTTPDPEISLDWPAPRAARGRLEALLPIDVFRWPALRGEVSADTVDDLVDRFAAAIKPGHHAVDVSGTAGELLLSALTRRPAKSLTLVGFFPSPATLAALGLGEHAPIMGAAYAIAANPAQILAVSWPGLGDEELARIVGQIEAGLDKAALTRILAEVARTNFADRIRVTIPTLYLPTPLPIPKDLGLEVLPRYVSDLRTGALSASGLGMGDEASGYELADRIVEFITEVMESTEQA